MKLERIETSDGSHTYINHSLDVSYRSVHGAKSESLHVFVDGTGLPKSEQKRWAVLELGFGTGMNFSTTYEYTQANNIKLEYYSLEPALMPIENLLIDDDIKLKLSKRCYESENLSLKIIDEEWENWKTEKEFDAYYHDPFGPKTSPDCWTKACFEWALGHLKSEGRLATYGASSAARKAMHAAGFAVAKRPGAGRKREMTVAAMDRAQLADSKVLNFHTK